MGNSENDKIVFYFTQDDLLICIIGLEKYLNGLASINSKDYPTYNLLCKLRELYINEVI